MHPWEFHVLDAIGNIAEFFGALGVIASLAYLGVQVRQNTKSSRAAAQQSAMAQFVDFNFRLAEDESLAVLLRKGLRDAEQLTEGEWARFDSLLSGVLIMGTSHYALHRQEIITTSDWEPTKNQLAGLLARPGGAAWWNSRGRSIADAAFAALVQRAISEQARPSLGESSGDQ